MKFLFLFFVVGLTSVACSTFFQKSTWAPLTEEAKMRHQNIMRLFNQVTMDNWHRDQVETGEKWNFIANLEKFDDPQVVKFFYKMFMTDELLPKFSVFTVTNEKHRTEAEVFFKVLYSAKDFETFYRVACWARQFLNPSVFVYTMTVALYQRDDCKGFVMPPLYEIYPHLFIDSQILMKAQRVKMQKGVFDDTLAEFHGIRLDGKDVYIHSNYSGWYPKIVMNDEQLITYFTEDVGMNNFYYNFHAKYPFWMETRQEDKLFRAIRGERFMYMHQQLMARYYLERLSNSMGEIHPIKPSIRHGFMCPIEYSNGLKCPSRSNFYSLVYNDFEYDGASVEQFIMKLSDDIQRGFVETIDGALVSIKEPQDINSLGNILEGNRDMPMMGNFYQNFMSVAKRIFGGMGETPFYSTNAVPTAMEMYSMSLRDPVFYSMWRKFMILFYGRFKSFLKPYTHEELSFPGIKIENVQMDSLLTFFENYDFDMTNALYKTQEEFTRVQNENRFFVRQHRLNHKPFEVKVDFISDKTTDVIVKFFMAPKYNHLQKQIPLYENRMNFLELDSFVYNMKTGRNTLMRKSTEFKGFADDFYPEHMEFFNDNYGGFPRRMMLPKGTKSGLPVKFFVMVTPITSEYSNMLSGNYWWTRYVSKKPGMMGFPFDRKITSFYDFVKPNMFMLETNIYHDQKFNMQYGKNTPESFMNEQSMYSNEKYMNDKFINMKY